MMPFATIEQTESGGGRAPRSDRRKKRKRKRKGNARGREEAGHGLSEQISGIADLLLEISSKWH